MIITTGIVKGNWEKVSLNLIYFFLNRLDDDGAGCIDRCQRPSITFGFVSFPAVRCCHF